MSICRRWGGYLELVLTMLVVLALQGASAAPIVNDTQPTLWKAKNVGTAGDQEFKLEGNAAVSNYGAAEVEETPDDTWGYQIAEIDAMVSRAIISATAKRADGKITDADWPCVKKALDRISADVDASREAYESNPAVAVWLAARIQKDLAQIKAEIEE